MSAQRQATVALLIATCFWGAGFTWAKSGGEAVNRAAGLGNGALLGPIYLLAIRFIAAGLFWMIFLPPARRGWTAKSVRSSLIMGLLCGGGLTFQHLGLDRTSEAVSAFLTSLTVIFVPLLMMFALRRPPKGIVWIGIAVALVGIWLMTGATPQGFGIGELLGLACAITYSFQIIILNLLVPGDSSWRISGGMFLTIGLMTLACALAVFRGNAMTFLKLAAAPGVPIPTILLIVFSTLIAFGFFTHFQPRIDPTRASLLYLCEAICAALYAWFAAGKRLGMLEITGAILILLANAAVEIVGSKQSAKGSLDMPEPQASAGTV